MFDAVKHCFFPANIVFWEKTLFETSNTLFFGLKHCLSRKINEKTEKTMFQGIGAHLSAKMAGEGGSLSSGEDGRSSF